MNISSRSFLLYKDVTYFYAKSGIYYTPTYVISGYDGPGTENYFFQTTGVQDDPKVHRNSPRKQSLILRPRA